MARYPSDLPPEVVTRLQLSDLRQELDRPSYLGDKRPGLLALIAVALLAVGIGPAFDLIVEEYGGSTWLFYLALAGVFVLVCATLEWLERRFQRKLLLIVSALYEVYEERSKKRPDASPDGTVVEGLD